ncbi:PTS sugar transporter subunit IIA [Buchananella felis]|uniref:PTS sugar transporter subunit IIA n=1 Tax=Buchananella felis TaxID=3231492 RepID=UPI003529448D
MTLQISAPLAGKVVSLDEVPDAVFSQRIVGPGIAIQPAIDGSESRVVAPVAGKIVKFHPHAFVIMTAEGKGVLVHLGLDTVQLKGEGFTLHAAEKSEVEEGQLLVTWNPKDIEEGGRRTVCPIIALDGKDAISVVADEGADVNVGDPLVSWE